MKEKLMNIWKKHKVKIMFVGGVIVGTIIVLAVTRKGEVVTETVGDKIKEVVDWEYNFNTLEEAVEKFQELLKVRPSETVALWGGEGGYLVQDLS